MKDEVGTCNRLRVARRGHWRLRCFRGFVLSCFRGSLSVAALCAATALHAMEASIPPAAIPIADVRRTLPVSFTGEILPVLRQNCLACHSAVQAEADLVLETPDAMRKGGSQGPAIVPGKGAESRLLRSAAHQESPAMPPADNKVGAKSLTPEQLGLLKLWIDQGAQADAGPISQTIRRRMLPQGLRPILALAITPDDELIACNRGQQLFIYRTSDMQLAAELADPALGDAAHPIAHEDLIRSLAFDRSGQWLAAGGFRTVKLWRRPRSRLEREIVHNQPAMAMAASPDGRRIAIGLANGSIECHDLAGRPGENPPPKTFAGHEGAITGFVFSPDGSKLYSAAVDKTLRVWDATSGSQLSKQAVGVEVRALALVSQASQLATGDADSVIHIWPIASLSAGESAPIRELKGHSQPLSSLAPIADGDKLLSASGDGRLKLWNVTTGELLREFDHGGALAAVAVRADGRRFASAGTNGVARLWNADDGAMLAEIKGDPRLIRSAVRAEAAANYARACIEYRKEEHREAEEQLKRETAAAEGAVKAREQAEKTLTQKTEAANKAIEARTSAEAAANAIAVVLQEATTKKTAAQTAAGEADQAVKQAMAALDAAKQAAAQDKENKDLASARDAAEKALSETRQKKQAADAMLQQAMAEFREAERKNQEAKRSASQAAEKAKGPERELQEAKSALQGATNFIATANAVVERAKIAVPAAQTRVTEAEAEHVRREMEKKTLAEAVPGAVKPLRAICFSPDSALLAIAGEGGGLRLYDSDRGALKELLGDNTDVQRLAFVAGGRLIAAGADGKTRIFQTENRWRLERTIGQVDSPEILADRVLALDFSPDGKLLAMGAGLAARSGQVKLWNVANGQLVREISAAHRDTVFAVKFSPDGQHLATASADRLMKVFRVVDGALVRTFEGHAHHVLGVAWKPDGRLLATCGGDQVVKLWDFESGATLRTMRGDTYQLGDYRREVTSISFIGDTEHMLASSGDRSVRLHRTSSQRDVRAFRDGASFMHAAVGTIDGKLIFGGGRDGILHVWNGESGYQVQAIGPENQSAGTSDK